MSQERRVLEIRDILGEPDRMASVIARQYDQWKSARNTWETEKRELRNYIFATDTTTTTNAQLPWKNKTTLPKLCQIRDNLHANYMAALFPHEDWLSWEGAGDEDEAASKRKAIEEYMKNKTRISEFRNVVSQLVLDYIDYGNAFADVVYVAEEFEDDDGNVVKGYEGPRLVRISPHDIVFNIMSGSFINSPKITRHITTMGDLVKNASDKPELQYNLDAVSTLRERRAQLAGYDPSDINKSVGYQIDGFGDTAQYFHSDMVELLEFEGDFYDVVNNELHENRVITIVDRHYVIRNEPMPSWLGKTTKRHVGWRLRPDNLMAMGPLDNLVGMQYRIDHLENLKADVFDLIAHPPIKIQGNVSEFVWAPMEKIYVDEDGDVQMMAPDTNALNADMQIQILEQKMEEYAGAPREAMGIRTPGEKTAYEIQALENAAGRIFQNKIQHFEEQFLEPLLNVMLDVARRNIQSDVIRIFDDDFGAAEFLKVGPEDIQAKGKLRPIGARHFSRRAQIVQELTQFMNTIGQDPGVRVHVSGKKLAEMFEEFIGVEGLVRDNVAVIEEMQTQSLMSAAQEEQGMMEDTPGIDDIDLPDDEAMR